MGPTAPARRSRQGIVSRRTMVAWRTSAAILTLALAAAAHAQTSAPEAALKVAFVYNFTKFTEWPATVLPKTAAPLNVCALGRDPLGTAWNALEGKSAQGHPIAVRRAERVEDTRGCHLVFVAVEARAWPEVLKSLQAASILSVGDTEGFARAGGAIELNPIGNRMQFDVNLEATQRAGLKISSQVLKLARTVIGDKK